VPVRLTHGDNQYGGRVEVLFNGQWGTVCNNNWDIEDAKYVTAGCEYLILCTIFTVLFVVNLGLVLHSGLKHTVIL